MVLVRLALAATLALPGVPARAAAAPAAAGVARFQEDPADAAWRAGDTDRALALYRARLEADPRDALALHRVALIRARAGAYDEALDLMDRLLAFRPDDLEARLDRARFLAWSGDVTAAITAVEEVLRDRPAYPPALEVRATFEAWAGRYDASLSTYDELLSIAPDNVAARRQAAQVLSWASRFDASRAVYDSILAENPDDVEARLGLARSLAFAGDLDGSVATYRAVLARHPDHLPALHGLGQALSWDGRLVDGEAAFRQAVSLDADDVAGLTGLAQNLRWQGRNAAALEYLDRAEALAPTDGDVREQRRWVEAALAPSVRPSVVLERDSDDNRMLTAGVAASWHPLPRLGLRADAYRRTLEQNALTRSASGLRFTGSWQLEPGWTVSAGVGASASDGTGAATEAAWNAGLASPERYPVVVTATVASSVLDASAILVERQVRLTEVGAVGRFTPTPAWRVDVAAGRGTFEGGTTNHRSNLSVSASRKLSALWTLGAGARAFAFERDVNDGYFDPDFYGMVEATGRWLYQPGTLWGFLVEAAPGIQQVGEGGEPSAMVRVSARVALRLGPGRELSVSGGYSSAGLQTFATGSADYRYTALILGGSWVF